MGTIAIARQAMVDDKGNVFGYTLFDRTRPSRTHGAVSTASQILRTLVVHPRATMQHTTPSLTESSYGHGVRPRVAAARRPLQLGLASAALFTLLAWAVHFAEPLLAWEQRWLEALHAQRKPWLTEVLHGVEALHDPLVAIALSLFATALVFRRRGWQLLLLLAITLGGGAVNNLAKAWFQRPRPELDALVSAHGHGFPSGHTVAATLLAAWAVYAAYRGGASTTGRAVTVCAAALVVGLVGLSRIYLGAHYPTDVAAAVLGGTAWACGCIAAFGAMGIHGGTPRAAAVAAATVLRPHAARTDYRV